MSENYCPNVNELSCGADRPHVSRYLLARGFVKPTDYVLDVACGYGYGTYLISEFANQVCGIEKNDDAINSALSNYKRENNEFRKLNLETELDKLPECDCAISIETIEHLEDPQAFLDKLMEITKERIIISSPNKPTADESEFHKHDVQLEVLERMAEKNKDWVLYHTFLQGYIYMAIFIKKGTKIYDR